MTDLNLPTRVECPYHLNSTKAATISREPRAGALGDEASGSDVDEASGPARHVDSLISQMLASKPS